MFLKFVVIFLLSLLAADVYIYFAFLRHRPWVWTALLAAIFVIMATGVCFFFVKGKGAQYIEIFILIFFAVALPQIVFAALSILDLPLGLLVGKRVWPMTMAGLVVGTAVLVIMIYGSTAGTTHFKVHEVTFSSDRLSPEFDGYRIAQLSDIHLSGWGKHKRSAMERMVGIVNEQGADAVMITGDLVHHRATELNGVEDVLARIEAPDGVWSVLGNHDYGPYIRFDSKEAEAANLRDLELRQERMGWRLLRNDHAWIVRGNDSIAIVGVENGGEGSMFADHSDLPKAMTGIDHGSFTVLMSHDPTHWEREALGAGVDLTLAGHTHGGQFSIAGLSFARLMYRQWGGMYIKGDQGLYVNVGIGQTGLAFRFGAWPEITVITLKRSGDEI